MPIMGQGPVNPEYMAAASERPNIVRNIMSILAVPLFVAGMRNSRLNGEKDAAARDTPKLRRYFI